MTNKTVVTLDSGDGQLEIEILKALARSNNAADASIGKVGQVAFDRAQEAGEGVQSALGLARLAMAEYRAGAA